MWQICRGGSRPLGSDILSDLHATIVSTSYDQNREADYSVASGARPLRSADILFDLLLNTFKKSKQGIIIKYWGFAWQPAV